MAGAVGTYRNDERAHTVRVVREADTLFLQPDALSTVELKPSGPRQFRGRWDRTGNVEVELNIDETGSVTGLTAAFLLRYRSYRKID